MNTSVSSCQQCSSITQYTKKLGWLVLPRFKQEISLPSHSGLYRIICRHGSGAPTSTYQSLSRPRRVACSHTSPLPLVTLSVWEGNQRYLLSTLCFAPKWMPGRGCVQMAAKTEHTAHAVDMMWGVSIRTYSVCVQPALV